MVTSKSKILNKVITISFTKKDLDKIVREYKKYLENEELFKVETEDEKGNKVVIELSFDEE